MTSPLWRYPVTRRHRDHAQSITHRQVYIGSPLEPSRYLASFPRYLTPKLRTDRTNDRTKDRQTREVNIRVAKAERSRTNNNNLKNKTKNKNIVCSLWGPQKTTQPLIYAAALRDTCLLSGPSTIIASPRYKSSEPILWWYFQRMHMRWG